MAFASYLFMGLMSSTRDSNVCREGVAVEVVDEVCVTVSFESSALKKENLIGTDHSCNNN